MSLTPGTRLGPYEILAALGAGGMGEVYRATDSNLKRSVAIKVLPASVAGDADRLTRFQREAEVLAALNHPNIAAIYGLEKTADLTALIMELVEGEDLSAHIARGAIPLGESLPIARQVADALEAAHEQGIVHRDLKPANIKVRADGTVKVLDFGLAKAMDPVGTSGADAMNSPTLTARATQMGMILGTAAYMAPEQAKGKFVDKRADIWAFGVVLHEMLTGRRLFDAEDISETLAAVLTRDLSLPAMPADIPPRLRALLRDCLVRDPKQRLRDIGDARLVLDKIIAGAPDETGPPAAATATIVPTWRRALPWVVAGSLAVVALALWAPWRVAPVDDRQIRFSIATPDTLAGGSATVGSLIISPDGRLVVFASPPAVGKPQVLWVRPIAALEAQPLAGTEGASSAFWSPDSRYVGFVSGGKLKKVDVRGGPPQTLCDVGSNFAGGTWNREGVILVSQILSLFRVSEAGGPLSEVFDPSQRADVNLNPAFLPDGRHFIYLSLTKGAVYAGSLDGGPPALVLNVKSKPAYAPGGFLMYQREGTLFAHAFDPKRLQVSGEPVRVADDVVFNSTTGSASFSVSDTGVLVFRTGAAVEANADLAWVNRAGKPMGTVGDPAAYRQVRLSPDEKRVVMSRADVRTGKNDLFTLDLTSHITSRLTFEGDDLVKSVEDPMWLPDGRAVAFESRPQGKLDFYQQIVGTRDVTLVFESQETPKYIDDWSPDGRFLIYHTPAPSKLYALPLSGDRKPVLLAQSQKGIDESHFSPDGKWVSYNTDETGQAETWVASFPAFDKRRQVSAHGGGQARWRADGKEIFYLTPDGKMMSATVVPDAKTRTLEFSAPIVLFQSPIAKPSLGYDQWDVSRDGQRFLFIQPLINPNATTAPLAPITVVVNWMAGIKK